MPPIARIPVFCLCVLIGVLLLAGCGARLDQIIEVHADGTGRVVVSGSVGSDDVSKLGADRVTQALRDHVPSGWELEVNSTGGSLVFTASAGFQNAAELQQVLTAVTGARNPVQWKVTRTPFYQGDQMQVSVSNQAWAQWAREALATLTSYPAFDDVHSYIQWPGEPRQPLYGQSVHDRHGFVQSLTTTLHWRPDGVTRSIDLTPGDGDVFMPVQPWLQQTLPEAAVTTDTAGVVHVQLKGATAPWGLEETTQVTHLGLFWDRVTLRTLAPDPSRWLGPGVPVGHLSTGFDGTGWWGTRDQGPPDWQRWPGHTSQFSLNSEPAAGVIQLVGYRARPALYAAWVLVPLWLLVLLGGLTVAVIWLRRHRGQWSVVFQQWRLPSLPAVRPVLWTSTWRPMAGGSGGPASATAPVPVASDDRMPADVPSVGLWARLAWQRLLLLLRMHPEPLEMPWQAAVLSMATRVVTVALLLDRWANALLADLAHFVLGGSWLQPGDTHVSLFWWLLLAYGAAAAACVLLMILHLPRHALAGAMGTLSDAQWTLVGGLAAAWLLSSLSVVLSAGAVSAGCCWGQAVTSTGLQRLPISDAHRMRLQMGLGAVSVMVLILVAGGVVKHAMGSIR